MQHPGRAPARDRDGHVPVAVLVQDHVPGARVRERPRHDRVVALARVLELETRARDEADPLHVVPGQVERYVAEAVDVEKGRDDRAAVHPRPGEVEVDEPVESERWTKLLERYAACEVRSRRGEQISPV